jgi:hypothetical protein
MGEIIDYNKLRLDVLEKMIHQRGIDCKMKKDEMIRILKLYDDGKYTEPIRDTLYIKDDSGYMVGVDMRSRDHIMQISKLLEKKDAKNLNRFSDNRIWYWVPQKLI